MDDAIETTTKDIEELEFGWTYDKESHEYRFLDNQVMSVTQLIPKLLNKDIYNEVPDNILKKAAEYGTKIHSLIEKLEDGEELSDLSIEEKHSVLQYKTIKDFETKEKELFVHYENIYCGRVDGIGENIIYDIKTTSKLYEDNISLQLSMYLLAYDKENYEKYKGYVLWLPKKGTGKKIEIPLYKMKDILIIVERIKVLDLEINEDIKNKIIWSEEYVK